MVRKKVEYKCEHCGFTTNRKTNFINQAMILSTNKKNKENIKTITNTIAVVMRVSFLVGHTIFCPSCFTSFKNLLGLKSFIIVETL